MTVVHTHKTSEKYVISTTLILHSSSWFSYERYGALPTTLIASANSSMKRVDDSSGGGGSVFRTACDHLGPLAQQARIEPEALAATVFDATATLR